jgi:hypothetical protein
VRQRPDNDGRVAARDAVMMPRLSVRESCVLTDKYIRYILLSASIHGHALRICIYKSPYYIVHPVHYSAEVQETQRWA